MGALDPHIHKRNQHLLSGTHAEVARAASETGQLIVSMEELPTEIWPTFVTPDDYYSQVMFRLCTSIPSCYLKLVIPCRLRFVRL